MCVLQRIRKDFAKKIFVKNFETQQLKNEQPPIFTGIARFCCKVQDNKLLKKESN